MSAHAGVIEEPPATAHPVTTTPHVVADLSPQGRAPSRSAIDEALDIALQPAAFEAAGGGTPQAPAASEEELLGTLSVPAVLPLLGVGLIALRLFTERRLRRQHLRRRQRSIAGHPTH